MHDRPLQLLDACQSPCTGAAADTCAVLQASAAGLRRCKSAASLLTGSSARLLIKQLPLTHTAHLSRHCAGVRPTMGAMVRHCVGMSLAKCRSFSSSSRVHSVFLMLGSNHSYLGSSHIKLNGNPHDLGAGLDVLLQTCVQQQRHCIVDSVCMCPLLCMQAGVRSSARSFGYYQCNG